MSFDGSGDELERQLATMLRERAASVSERMLVDQRVITRARRRRSVKVASFGSGAALVAAVVIVAALAVGGRSTSTRITPASPGPSVQLSTPPTVDALHAVASGWTKLPPAPLSARAASATEVTRNAFVVWGGAGQGGQRLMDGAWLDRATNEWHRMRKSPLPPPSYPEGQHFVIGQAIGDSVVIVSDGAVAQYTPATDSWTRLPDVPLAKIDNLALNDGSRTDAIVLTGVDRQGGPAFAMLNFDPTGRAPVWTTGTLTGRSVGRPVLTSIGLKVVVNDHGALELDTVLGVSGYASSDPLPGVPSGFWPAVWNGSSLIGGTCRGCNSSTLVALDTDSHRVRTIPGAYDACAALHVWTGRFVVSWGATSCAGHSGVASDPAANARSGATTALPRAPISDRRASDFGVGPDGIVYVWGGEDASGRDLGDGAALNLG